jgi:hypothetical protein
MRLRERRPRRGAGDTVTAGRRLIQAVRVAGEPQNIRHRDVGD